MVARAGTRCCHNRAMSVGLGTDAVIVRDGMVLLTHHLDSDLWVFAGGAVDPGESPWDAAVRETAEGGDGQHDETRSIVLEALIAGLPIDNIADELRPNHREGSTYPASVLMELAADAYLACGTSRTDRLEVDGLAERMLPEDPARGNAGHSKRRHTLQGAIMIAAGAEPEETGWWSFNDLWRHALDAVVIFVCAAAERQGTSVEVICRSLARS